ncbi:uncharacterized WD repeat-containing protein C2A9.03-like [Abrus precatorius]|uniref:Uncharacterized WD repeat-containing protein C2A9.03-like n=1 Tax=Abrus precatorius TaxID=3816 RepID=A0A8B8L5H2_ABRPR|nr:uncharacterized WD repeat-containing protein C2A9.03-like [Abrus precatorius]
MEQPEVYEELSNEHLVCRLKKSLYDLKQAPRQWYKKFESFMTEHSFKKTTGDHCVFIRRYEDETFLILFLYVDDMLIIGHDKTKIASLKNALSKSFAMKDLGPTKQILGMKVIRDHSKKLIWLSQEKYIEKILKRFNMDNSKLVSISLTGHFKLSNAQCPTSDEEKTEMSRVPYSFVVGSLIEVDTKIPERNYQKMSVLVWAVCRLDKKGVSFCTRTTHDDNATTNAIEIYDSLSGATHLIASNNDCGVREYDTERFQPLNHLQFPWPVNHTSISPDRKLMTVVGDHLDGLLVDPQNGKTVATLVGHRDYSFASAWHPDGHTFATGNQDKTFRVWDARHLSSPIAILKGNIGATRSIRFSSDGQFMVVAEPADFVHVYSTKADYKKRQEIDFFGEISGFSLSPDDECMYIGIWDRTYASLLQYNRRHQYEYLESYF